jgi:antitoxin (DNA-binding transcriptional repressor) of toxin-antitoxin stability system
LSKLIARVEAGEEITIMRRDKPVARLVASEAAPGKIRARGAMPELAILPEDLFLKPMDPEKLELWYGGD